MTTKLLYLVGITLTWAFLGWHRSYIGFSTSSSNWRYQGQSLILNSYYKSNVIDHLRNFARESKVNLNIKSECVNGVDGFTMYGNGGIRIAFGSQRRISRLNNFLEEYSECFTEEYKKILLSLNGIKPLLDDFQVDIHSLIPKAKYGHNIEPQSSPKVIPPRHSSETRSPLFPRSLYLI